jgi:hypothetical protein
LILDQIIASDARRMANMSADELADGRIYDALEVRIGGMQHGHLRDYAIDTQMFTLNRLPAHLLADGVRYDAAEERIGGMPHGELRESAIESQMYALTLLPAHLLADGVRYDAAEKRVGTMTEKKQDAILEQTYALRYLPAHLLADGVRYDAAEKRVGTMTGKNREAAISHLVPVRKIIERERAKQQQSKEILRTTDENTTQQLSHALQDTLTLQAPRPAPSPQPYPQMPSSQALQPSPLLAGLVTMEDQASIGKNLCISRLSAVCDRHERGGNPPKQSWVVAIQTRHADKQSRSL